MKKASEQCHAVVALDMIVGKWKLLILYHLFSRGTLRFNELRKLIPSITQRMLTLHLRELEEQDIVKRVVYPQVPPKVEYSITEYGRSLQPMLDTMHQFGMDHLKHMTIKNKQTSKEKL